MNGGNAERKISRAHSTSTIKRQSSLIDSCPKFHRQIQSFMQSTSPHSLRQQRNGKSSENWIPYNMRQKMVKREFSVAIENLESKQICKSLSHSQDEKQRSLSSFERSLSREKYGIEQRRPCGLCCNKFLPINLVMVVPLKAVFDIRDLWGDKFDPEGSRRVRVNPNLRNAPACYNSTKVCTFCAQLFDQQQETYRPSWEAKEAEKEHNRNLEEAEHWKVVNDPLSQVDKERIQNIERI